MNALMRVRPIARWRLRATRIATSIVLALGAGVWVMSTDELDAFAKVLSHQVTTLRPGGLDAVSIVASVPSRDLARTARKLDREGLRASFATTTAPSAATLRLLARLGDDVIPTVPGGNGLHWIHFTAELRREARLFHLRRGFYYLDPAHESFGELLLGSVAGGKGVTGSVQVGSRAPVFSRPLRPGDVVVLRLAGSAASSLRTVGSIGAAVRESGLAATPLPSSVS